GSMSRGPRMPSMPPMLIHFAILLALAGVIYLACEYFVNAIEWAGRKMKVGQQATGTVLAAFGTALPESIVTLVAVAFAKDQAQRDIGVGAALGGPLALATLAYAVVAVTLLLHRRTFAETGANKAWFRELAGDQRWFLAIFVVKLALGLFVLSWKPLLG